MNPPLIFQQHIETGAERHNYSLCSLIFHTGLQRQSIHHNRNVSYKNFVYFSSSSSVFFFLQSLQVEEHSWSAKTSKQSTIKSTLLGRHPALSCLLVGAHGVDVFKGQILQGRGKMVTMTTNSIVQIYNYFWTDIRKTTNCVYCLFNVFLCLNNFYTLMFPKCKKSTFPAEH